MLRRAAASAPIGATAALRRLPAPAAIALPRRNFSATPAELLWTPRPLSIDLPPHRYTIRDDDYRMPHLTYDPKDIEDVNFAKHRAPEGIVDRLGRGSVTLVRSAFDHVTGFSRCYPNPVASATQHKTIRTEGAGVTTTSGAADGHSAAGSAAATPPLMTTSQWLLRAIFLETGGGRTRHGRWQGAPPQLASAHEARRGVDPQAAGGGRE